MDIQKQNTPNKFMLNLEYGVSIQFSSMSNNFVMGDNYSKKNNKGINSLNMAIDCKFSELTDSESSQAIAFLQKNYFYSAQNYNSAGKFTNLDVLYVHPADNDDVTAVNHTTALQFAQVAEVINNPKTENTD